jgi:ribonuclease G
MSKLIITEIKYKEKKRIFSGLYENNRFYQVSFSDMESDSGNIGDIYVGRVKDVVKNINAAFVEYKNGCVGYLSLSDNKNVIYLNNKNTDKICEGDMIIVQIEKAAIKTKFPVLTSNISISGRNLVLNIGKYGIGYSGKIKDKSFKEKNDDYLKEYLNDCQNRIKTPLGLIVRTNAENSSTDALINELDFLINEWESVKNAALTRKCYSVIRKSEPAYLSIIKGSYEDEISEIITDAPKIYDEVKKYIELKLLKNNISLNLYTDTLLELSKLYSIQKNISDVLSKKVWLKSGAYLIIEPTEAMVVIDVNTGKNITGKNMEETILNVNKEAAREIAYQLRLRNLSGIIIIDFINMSKEESRKELMEYLKYCVMTDRIKTNIIDMTKLELVEITRKKVEPPIYQQLMQ